MDGEVRDQTRAPCLPLPKSAEALSVVSCAVGFVHNTEGVFPVLKNVLATRPHSIYWVARCARRRKSYLSLLSDFAHSITLYVINAVVMCTRRETQPENRHEAITEKLPSQKFRCRNRSSNDVDQHGRWAEIGHIFIIVSRQ